MVRRSSCDERDLLATGRECDECPILFVGSTRRGWQVQQAGTAERIARKHNISRWWRRWWRPSARIALTQQSAELRVE